MLELPISATLTEYPLSDVGRTVPKFNAALLASPEKPNHLNVHERDVFQIHNQLGAIAAHLSLQFIEMLRLDSPDQSNGGCFSVRVPFNSEHLPGPLSARTYRIHVAIWKLLKTGCLLSTSVLISQNLLIFRRVEGARRMVRLVRKDRLCARFHRSAFMF